MRADLTADPSGLPPVGRHSFNSALANAGVSEEIRMKLTGHSSKGMNARYTHLEVGTLKTAMTSLPLFGPEPSQGSDKDS